MKMSLLEMVQDILNDLDSDYVNSIDDTVESQQVSQILRTTYNELISNRNWPHLKKLVQLEASTSLAKPVFMKLVSGTKEVSSVRYDCKKDGETAERWKEIKYKTPEEFLHLTSSRDLDKDNVISVKDWSGNSLLIIDNKAPEFYTSFDDNWVVFDSYDKAVDDTLKKSKSQCFCVIEPQWEQTDAFIPDLPEEAFAAFLAEAKSTSFYALKQMPNQKAEQIASRQQRWLSRKAWRVNGGLKYPDYGRK
jgi:hypothetical protein